MLQATVLWLLIGGMVTVTLYVFRNGRGSSWFKHPWLSLYENEDFTLRDISFISRIR